MTPKSKKAPKKDTQNLEHLLEILKEFELAYNLSPQTSSSDNNFLSEIFSRIVKSS